MKSCPARISARSRQRPDVYPEHRVSVAGDHRPAAALDALRLFRPMGLGRHARSHPRRALCAVPPSRLARGEPDRRDHRQPERQERGKRGPAIDPTGYDAGKKIKGRKRHILVDTQGLLMHAIVHAADVQDRDGGALLMASLFGAFPFLIKLYADGGYQGPEFQSAVKRILARVNVEIVKRSDQATASSHCPSAGSSNAPSLGSAAADDSPKTGNVSTTRLSPSCASIYSWTTATGGDSKSSQGRINSPGILLRILPDISRGDAAGHYCRATNNEATLA